MVKSIPASAKNLMEVDISEAVINGVHYLRGKSKVKVFEDGGHLKCCIDDGFCFVAGTPIWTKNDTFKPIEAVKKGDEVWSFDHQNNRPVSNKVTRTFIRTKDQLLKILIGATMLMVTPEHPLFANGAYTKASELRVGDEVSSYDGRASLVKSIEAIDTLVTVYNFEVEKAHNYFVGDDRLLVHNTCGWETIMEKLDVEALRTFSNEVINAGLLPYQRRNVYEALKKLPREALTAITSELGKNHDFLKAVASQPEYVKAWSVFAEAEDVLTRAYCQSEEHLEAVASYLRSHPDADLVKLYDDYKLARDKDEWFKRMARNGSSNLEIDLDKLLKNPDYKLIYDDFVNGVSKRRFADEFTLEEEAVLRFYTNKSYFKFNQALINGTKSDDVLELEKLLNRTLDKLPSSPGERYRGVGKNEVEYFRSIGKGGVIQYKNFLSTTSEKEKAWEFFYKSFDKTGEAAWVKVISKKGKGIDKYSDAVEWEYLHKSGAKFEIKSFEVEKDYIINLQEVLDYGDQPKKMDLITVVLKEL